MPARLVRPTERNVAAAAALLRGGGVVAFPTETVYGLGADTFSEAGLAAVYQLKGRPADNPLIAHVLDERQAKRVAARWDDRCARLAQRYWPGPLTLVLPRAEDLPQRATAGWPTVAVRAPAHPVARALLEAFGGPVSAPSANRSGGVSPTTAAHVVRDFADVKELLVLDGGPCSLGIESTVLDLTASPPCILRPGAVSLEALRQELGEVALAASATQAQSPGTSMRHYAPRTPAELLPRQRLLRRLAQSSPPVVVVCFPGLHVGPPHRAILLPGSPEAAAARLYSALREADEAGAALILIEEPPSDEGLWLAIRDRLRRATGNRPPAGSGGLSS
jgi:L-threonylcarbamoyladenylate synthase